MYLVSVDPMEETLATNINGKRGRSQSMLTSFWLICTGMALPVMEFQVQRYKIRKIFALKSTYPKEIIEF